VSRPIRSPQIWPLGALTVAAIVLLAPAGQAATPALSWMPSTNGAYDYGAVNVGQTLSQTFTLTNSGSAARLTITLSGSSTFTKTLDSCTGTTLGPKKSCTVTVQYAPTSSISANATLSATSNKPGAIGGILTLSGNGTTRHIYWTNLGIGTIGRANLNGTNPNQNFIPSEYASNAVGLAVDSNHIYWANQGFGGNGTIGRANLDGTNPDRNFITDAFGPQTGRFYPTGVAVDSNYIYWNDVGSNTIGRANLDGTTVDQNFITTGVDVPEQVVVDSNYVYWANFGRSTIVKSTIGRATLDGRNVNQDLITGANGPYRMAIDSSFVYWFNFFGNTIGRADLDGGNVNQSFITGATQNGGPAGGPAVAVDSN
jgi:hypothetical protein